jgi:hypothetical protein
MALASIIQRTTRMEPPSGRWSREQWIEPAPSTDDPALERHYSVNEIAKSWGLSGNTIRRMFEKEPGVIEWGAAESRFARGYRTLRIPESVMLRVHQRLRKRG